MPIIIILFNTFFVQMEDNLNANFLIATFNIWNSWIYYWA